MGSSDFKAMVFYKKCLLNNHIYLQASFLEGEMSNTGLTGAMSFLTRRFPFQTVVK